MTEAAPAEATNHEDLSAWEAAALSGKLEAVFDKIQRERMAGIPILNSALRVASVGMQRLGPSWLSVLITPWFINVMLLPGSEAEAEAWAKTPIGTKITRALPCGTFEFIAGSENGIGPYQMCSLFSPVLEIQDQAAALAVAEASLTAVLDESLHPDNQKKAAAAAAKEAAKDAARVSRRDLFSGLVKERGGQQ